MSRPYEIAVLGATGFTGKLVCAWLAEQVPDLRWALAGRNLHKLEAVRQDLLASHPHLEGLPLIHADTTDPDSLAALASQTSVLLTTTGPYVKYGPPVVDACVEAGTDYVDITGEPSFVAETIRRHDEAARAKGLSDRQVLYGHIFRNAMLIVIAGFPGVFIGVFFGSSLIIETIFSLDGLGRMGFEAAVARDYPVIFGTLFVFGLVGLLVGILSDLMYVLVDPRIDFDTRES